MPPRLASDYDVRVLLRTAIVESVDTRQYTFQARFVSNEAPAQEVPVGGAHVSARGSGWLGAMPSKGDMVLLASPVGEDTYFMIAARPYPDVNELEDGTEVGSRSSYANGRPPLPEGTVALFGPSGGYLTFRPGGVAEIHVDPFCRQMFFADSATVQTVCQNFILEGAFGLEELFTLRSPERDDADATPTGKRAYIKTLAQHAPVIFEDAGAVMEEEGLQLPGYPATSTHRFGHGICYRFMIFEQSIADQEAAAGIVPPNPTRASICVRMDQAGNISTQTQGLWFLSARDRTVRITGRDVVDAHSIEMSASEGKATFEAATLARLEGRKRLELSTRGVMALRAREVDLRAKSLVARLAGGASLDVGGSLKVDALGSGSLTFGGDLSFGTGGSFGGVVGGRFSLQINGQDALENLGRDVVACKFKVSNGKFQVQTERGTIELALTKTPAGPALAGLQIHGDAFREAPYFGRAELYSGLARLTLDPTGALELQSAAGGVTVDPLGSVQLGPKLGVAGYVVTTLSHRDYVTGLPLMGTTSVSATQIAPGVPLPVPAPPVLPPLPRVVNLPDDIAFT